MDLTRASGILLPLFSIPGPYGIGTLGKEAYDWIDFLASANQKYWQILPLVPSGGGNSPYMSPTSFGGNPLFLDLETLEAEGLLTKAEVNSQVCADIDRVDYEAVIAHRTPLFHKAWERGKGRYAPLLLDFLQQEGYWLPDYAFFMALSEHFQGLTLQQWPVEVIQRDPATMARYQKLLAEQTAYHAFLQFLFFTQWQQVKAYANQKGIAIIGDLPIYVSLHSADLWANPELFQLKEDFTPSAVAGVPPDAFTDKGQHWGNPLYDWPQHQATGYRWWMRRGGHMARLYDMVRIDHFRGFHTYWSIPEGAEHALEGHWEDGPGMELVELLSSIPELNLIAEDLGDLDQEALDFIHNSGLPGMKILLYAFDPKGESAYLPHNCTPHSICYSGTHDSPTFVEWLMEEASPEEKEYATQYLQLTMDEGLGWGAVRGAWATSSALAIAPFQDLLGLGKAGRVNTPGTTGEANWSWRVRHEALNPSVSSHLAHLTHIYRR